MARILIIDDDPNICRVLTKLIKSIGHVVSVANNLQDGCDLAYRHCVDLVLLDLGFPNGNGLQILPDILKAPSSPEVIIITGNGDTHGAKQAFKHGAWDYIRKPFTLAAVSLPISRALQYHGEKGSKKTPVPLNRSGIIGESEVIRSCFEEVAKASVTDASVLITGETGTGKELFAKAIHENSKRASRDFVTVDCGALPENLAESTLFGHEKGAFTGADQRQEGLILQAEGGTLFLDEIGDLPLNIQISLLRTLQERRIRPLGGKKEIPVDFRLVSATNRNLDNVLKEKNFREDLFFRIRAIAITLPPLRDRKNDIQEITIQKTLQLGRRYGLGLKGISPEFLENLSGQDWPGNVRELINVLEYALASAGPDPILFPKHLPMEYRTARIHFDSALPRAKEDQSHEIPDRHSPFPSWPAYRQKTEKDYLRLLLEKSGGSRKQACLLSAISQSRLYGLLKKHNLSRFRAS